MSQTNHLLKRKGVFYYHRRVPLPLVSELGKKVILFSLGTRDAKEAKKRRAAEDLKWAIRFEAAEKGPSAHGNDNVPSGQPPSDAGLIRLVQDYVERTDERASSRALSDPPTSQLEKDEIKADIEIGLDILKNPDDPRSAELAHTTGAKILKGVGTTIDDKAVPYDLFTELVRRALLELQNRKHARIDDDFSHGFFDQTFDSRRPADVTFGQAADQLIQVMQEEATANGVSLKWIDKQRANVALLKEVIGSTTPLRDVDYDTCLKVRSVLARIPAGRTKAYGGLSIEEAIVRGQADNRSGLSPVTQDQYLATLRSVLDLALKKRLIAANPAEGLKPLRRDNVQASAKRIPFTSEQLKTFFQGRYYRECTLSDPPYRHDKNGWRFWLPLMCLFMGLRPNEICQARAADVKRTDQGTWYVDVVASTDEDDDPGAAKTLKTATSRRRVPIHPELIAIGLVDFAQGRLRAGDDAPLFGGLKPDNYGNFAKYPLKRFRDSFLPEAIQLDERQSFYSLRHNFRDALRRADAPPDALQALGGWSQGRLVSDDYGDKSDPDYQARFMSKVSFPGLNLEHLRMTC